MTEADDLTLLISLLTRDPLLEQLQVAAPNAEIRLADHLEAPDCTLPAELMKGCDAVLAEFLPTNIDDFDELKWIQLSSAGYTQVLDLPILDRGIRVTNGRGNFDIGIAEWNVMMMLMTNRHVPEMMEHQRQETWDRSARFQVEMRGMTVGLYGYGGIGRATARLCRTMGLQVWALTRDGTVGRRDLVYCVEGSGDPEGVMCDRVFGPSQEDAFLEGLDFLVLAVPITPATTGIIGEKQLRRLKPSAVLINPARAGLVIFDDFERCMREGWIRAAAFDVHYAYPPPDDYPLWSVPNTIVTPHISGTTLSPCFLERVYDIFSRNVTRWIDGAPLLNELTPAQLRGE
ncbi:MAG: hypothetical protein CMJ18_08385 [Phycisphaeraceae bacterium]|jgi:phosphoglycerate dehydrogenase-like enzyme|nr:hypothetical protein [Phycisphaeraceae bacterium]